MLSTRRTVTLRRLVSQQLASETQSGWGTLSEWDCHVIRVLRLASRSAKMIVPGQPEMLYRRLLVLS